MKKHICILIITCIIHLPLPTAATNHIYHLEDDKYIEWVTCKDNPEIIIGYNIFTEQYNSLSKASYTLIEETIITNPLSLSYVLDKSQNQQIHHIGPLMLFIEDTPKIYFDISANESLPDFLFNEIITNRKNFNINQPAIESPIHLDSNNYIFQTTNYLAYFFVDIQSDICYKITDPLNPQQYSLVYVQ